MNWATKKPDDDESLMHGVFAPAKRSTPLAIKKQKTSNDLRHLHLQILHDYTYIYIL